MNVAPQSVSYMKAVSASTNPNPHWTGIESINNGDWAGAYWEPAKDDKTPWAAINLGNPQKVSKAVIYESGQNIKTFELQYESGNEWKSFYKGTTIGPKAEFSFNPVNAQVIRLVITSFSDTPGIYEIMLLTD